MQSTPDGTPCQFVFGRGTPPDSTRRWSLEGAVRGNEGDGSGSAARQNFREEALLRKRNELGRIRIEHRPLGRCIVGLVFGVPIWPIITHQPDKLVSLLENPRAFNPKPVSLTQRVDARLPRADKVIHLPPVDRVHP